MTSRWKRICAASVALACSNTGGDAISVAERTDAERPSFAETRAIAEEGFVYGLPIVMNYAVMYEYAVDRSSSQFKAPFNQIHNEARVFTYQDNAIVTPNSVTPYSLVWLDLRAEPIVLSVRAVDKSRYYSVMLCDGNTFNYGYIDSRATGNAAGDYLVVGPDWNGAAPPGIRQVFRSSTQFSLAAYRTQLFGPKDIGGIEKVQAGYRVQPLSAYLKQPAPPAAPALTFPKIDPELVKRNFLAYLDFALQFAPPGPEEAAIRAKLARIGVGPGKTFDFKSLSLEHKAEVALGMKDGEKKVEASDRRGRPHARRDPEPIGQPHVHAALDADERGADARRMDEAIRQKSVTFAALLAPVDFDEWVDLVLAALFGQPGFFGSARLFSLASFLGPAPGADEVRDRNSRFRSGARPRRAVVRCDVPSTESGAVASAAAHRRGGTRLAPSPRRITVEGRGLGRGNAARDSSVTRMRDRGRA